LKTKVWKDNKAFRAEQESWDALYLNSKSIPVRSSVEDPDFVLQVTNELESAMTTVLVAGCGSNSELLLALASRNNSLVLANDYSNAAIEIQRRKLFTSSNVRLFSAPTSKLDFCDNGSVDAAISVSSILSTDESENERSMEELARVLRVGGKLIATFPNVLCAYELASLAPISGRTWLKRRWIRVRDNLVYEPSQNIYKRAYSPNRLRMLLQKHSFRIERLEIRFFDSLFFRSQAELNYGIPAEASPVIWETFLVANRATRALSS
jgi:SAM-dependent methyltransferase